MRTRYQPTSLHGRLALIVGCGFLAWLVMTSVAVFGFYRLLAGTFSRGRPADLPPLPPAPRLQIDPQADRAAFRAREDAWLGGYGWVDRRRGLVHVPIEKTLDLYAEGVMPQAPAASEQPHGGRSPGAWERGGVSP